MRIEINITADKSPGVLAKVIVALRRLSLNLAQQQMTEYDDTRLLELVVQGAQEVNTDTLVATMLGISGIEQAVIVGNEAPKVVQPVEEQPQTPIQGDSLAVEIANAFPNIGDLVTNQLESLKPELAVESMFALGMEVAQLRKDNFVELPMQVTMDTFIRDRLIPDIQAFSKLEVGDEGLKVLSSVFSKTKKASGFGFQLGGPDGLAKCDFLSGYIQGMLEATPSMEYSHVEETMCRKEGQPYCLFEFEQN